MNDKINGIYQIIMRNSNIATAIFEFSDNQKDTISSNFKMFHQKQFSEVCIYSKYWQLIPITSNRFWTADSLNLNTNIFLCNTNFVPCLVLMRNISYILYWFWTDFFFIENSYCMMLLNKSHQFSNKLHLRWKIFALHFAGCNTRDLISINNKHFRSLKNRKQFLQEIKEVLSLIPGIFFTNKDITYQIETYVIVCLFLELYEQNSCNYIEFHNAS